MPEPVRSHVLVDAAPHPWPKHLNDNFGTIFEARAMDLGNRSHRNGLELKICEQVAYGLSKRGFDLLGGNFGREAACAFLELLQLCEPIGGRMSLRWLSV